MKKILLYFVFTFCFFFLGPLRCLAWDTNYDITSITVDDNNQAIISGWAILNAKGNTGGSDFTSGVLVKTKGIWYLDSNQNIYRGGYCDYGTNAYRNKDTGIYVSNAIDNKYTYQYDLTIYPVYTNGTVGKALKDTVTQMKSDFVSLTYSQATKCYPIAEFMDLSCNPEQGDSNQTNCYEDTGFKFKINLNNLVKTEQINGYKLVLTIKPGSAKKCIGNCSRNIELKIIQDTNGSNRLNNSLKYTHIATQVVSLIYNGATWEEPIFNSHKQSTYPRMYPGDVFNVLAITINQNIAWYKISVGGQNGWVPSSWVEPAGEITLISSEKQIVDTDCVTSATPAPIVKNTNVCKATLDVNINSEGTCKTTLTNSEYYKVTCTESISTNFIPGDLTIKAGQGFTYGITVRSTNKCTGTFDEAKWLNAYNISKSNRDSAAKDSATYKEYDNKINDLIKMVENYNKWSFTDGINPNATLKIDYKRKGKTTSDSTNFIISDNKTISDKSVVIKTHNLSVSGLSNPKDFNYDIVKETTLSLPKVYINSVTGSISKTACTNCLDGGNKYYTDIMSDIGTYNLSVSVTNLGNFGNLTVNNNKCSTVITDNITNILYRPIDVTNPFIDSARNIGENWLNTKYSFVDVIDSNTWSNNNTSKYVFNLTNQNINNIKKNNLLVGGNGYLGSDCKINSETNKLECPFLLNNLYFHSVYVDGQYLVS